MPSTKRLTAPNVSTAGSAPTASLSQYLKCAVGDAEAADLQRLPDGGQCLVHHERTLHERRRRLVAINQRIQGGAGQMNRPGAVGSSLEHFAIRQTQHSALGYDHLKPRGSKSVRREEGFVSDQRPQLGPFGDQF